MGQQQSYSAGVPGSARWVEALKLALLTSTVAALQFVRYHLTNRDDRPQPQNRMLDEVPADIRRACVSFIDYHAMPLLVDQWRYPACCLSPCFQLNTLLRSRGVGVELACALQVEACQHAAQSGDRASPEGQ